MSKKLHSDVKFDEIGYWSEIKLDIIKKYASAYTTILSNNSLTPCYIDGFAGAGEHIKKHSREFVAGSPLNALNVTPPFQKHFLIDLDGNKVKHLEKLIPEQHRSKVRIFPGDCNDILLEEVFPNVTYKQYRRGLCLLDPYGLNLNWEVIHKAGTMGTFDIFLNFPIMGINRNALWRDPSKVPCSSKKRMTALWGDDSWRKIAYEKQPGLFDGIDSELGDKECKLDNEVVVTAFQKRLKTKAEFKYVPKPLPMRNSVNADIYYLFFASQQPVAEKIAKDIFAPYEKIK